jgi:hypothetical protein
MPRGWDHLHGKLPATQSTTFKSVFSRTVLYFMSRKLEYSELRGIKLGAISGSTPIGNGVGKAIHCFFLGDLKDESYVAASNLEVVEVGLEAVKRCFEVCKKGPMAKKVVVSLS